MNFGYYKVPCPTCFAEAGFKCRLKDGRLWYQVHPARVSAFLEAEDN